jgi:hypothetical protein
MVALCTVIIFQLLLPNHLDNQFNLVNVIAGLTGIGVALLLAPRFGAVGIAWSAVVAQLCSLIAFTIILARAGLNPFVPSAPASHRPSRSGSLTPVLAPSNGTQQMKLRLWEKLAEAEVEANDPYPVAMAVRDRAATPVILQNPR